MLVLGLVSCKILTFRKEEPVNVRDIVRQIHADIERGESIRADSPASNSAAKRQLTALRNSYARVYAVRHLAGTTPPSPDTLRGSLGKYLVRIVQRMLFWYTPQIHRFQDEATLLLDGLFRMVELQLDQIDSLRAEVTALRRDSWPSRTDSPQVAGGDSGVAGALPASFEYALQDHFRGSEQQTAIKLQVWLEAINGMANANQLKTGSWLDIGCGRGEWLQMVTKTGIRVTGIDPSSAVIAHCCEANLPAEKADALGWLERCPDASLAVITAFHVVEHLPPEGLVKLVQLAARKLQPRGILAIETPNPANLPMGAHRFWNDPTHQRPVPAALLRFVMNYFNVNVVKQLELNPCPEAEHLPFTEIEMVRRIDQLMYGPQDYGLIGVRES